MGTVLAACLAPIKPMEAVLAALGFFAMAAACEDTSPLRPWWSIRTEVARGFRWLGLGPVRIRERQVAVRTQLVWILVVPIVLPLLHCLAAPLHRGLPRGRSRRTCRQEDAANGGDDARALQRSCHSISRCKPLRGNCLSQPPTDRAKVAAACNDPHRDHRDHIRHAVRDSALGLRYRERCLHVPQRSDIHSTRALHTITLAVDHGPRHYDAIMMVGWVMRQPPKHAASSPIRSGSWNWLSAQPQLLCRSPHLRSPDPGPVERRTVNATNGIPTRPGMPGPPAPTNFEQLALLGQPQPIRIPEQRWHERGSPSPPSSPGSTPNAIAAPTGNAMCGSGV